MKRLLLLLVLVGCSSKSPAGPSGVDPVVLITNNSPSDTVYFTWRDGQGVVGTVTILAGRSQCTRFTARADSAYFDAVAAHGTYQQPWFDPTTRHAWTMDYSASTNGAGFLVTDRQQDPC